MDTFADEIKDILYSEKKQIINDKDTLSIFEKSSEVYLREIVDFIKESIRERVRSNTLDYIIKERFWSGFQKTNPHVLVSWSSGWQINRRESIFEFTEVSYSSPWMSTECHVKGFVLNDTKTLQYLLNELVNRLYEDNIFIVGNIKWTNDILEYKNKKSINIVNKIIDEIEEKISMNKSSDELTLRFVYFI